MIVFLSSLGISAQKFVHPTDVVKKIKNQFSTLESYQAEFSIVSERKEKKKYTKGMIYYKKDGKDNKVNFSFSNPANDVIISNGKKMWVYISKLNAVTVQDLSNKNAENVSDSITEEGIISLFSRYHYSFDTASQPLKTKNGDFYVLSLKEKVASGGFTEMKIYVDIDTYFINKIEAESPGSKKMTLTLSNVQRNIELSKNLFQFTIKDSMKVVENALTTN
jgi:outer membrane lipoprotein-sorting protein